MTVLHPDVERLALLGWRLYPASTHSRAACFKGATDAATYDLDQLAAWAARYPGSNWRVVMEGSGIWGLDCDVPSADHEADGVAALQALVAQHGSLPLRPTTRSGGGGCALFFHHRGEPIHGRTGWPAPGLDPRRGRLSVTVPPSVHITTGRFYRWLVAPWDVAPPSAPDWLLRAVAPPPCPVTRPVLPQAPSTGDQARSYALGALRDAVRQVADAAQGQRNDALNRQAWGVARFIGAGALNAAEVADALAVAARFAGLTPLEVERTLASALRAGATR